MTPETRWIGIFSALLLLLGIFIGIAMDRFLFRPPAGPASSLPPLEEEARTPSDRAPGRMLMARLTRALDLSEEQQVEIGKVFRRHLPKLRDERRAGGDIRGVRREMVDEISKILNEEQRVKFEEIQRRRMERIEALRGRPGERGRRRGDDAPRSP